ncbi:MAG TPA: polysaccharide biosynthesis tyrosine autokinase [Ktedonobacteraceae bacterium]|nr:polysaccharide biosynthesis tyrosine autokinase [Ktedonobacteraceae bacterium]
MQSPLNHYRVLAKRWAWLIILGIVLCGGGTYLVSKHLRPVYQASTFMILTLGSSTTSPYDSTSASLAALPTYAQLLKNPTVLNPVVAQHQGMGIDQLSAMITVNPQPNTQIIELDVQNSDPQLAMQLANQISQSFAQYMGTQFSYPAAVRILPAVLPTTPVSPRPLPFAGMGALVGLGLALALIVIFEWIDDRPSSPEEVQELLGADVLTVIPRLTRKQLDRSPEEIPGLAEGCRILSASLNAAQAIKPFKLVMITSAIAGEGKSTVAENLAFFTALSGKRVLLVDADLRSHILDQYFQLTNIHGLSDALQQAWTGSDIELNRQSTEIPTLQVLTAGKAPSNPADLLQSPTSAQVFEYFKRNEDYDYIIFDTPPLLPVADAQVLASHMQVTIFVVDASKTPRKILARARQSLKRMRTTVLGVVINKSKWPDSSEIHTYLSELYQQQARTRTHTTLAVSPETPLPRGLERPAVDKEETVTLPRTSDSLSGKEY